MCSVSEKPATDYPRSLSETMRVNPLLFSPRPPKEVLTEEKGGITFISGKKGNEPPIGVMRAESGGGERGAKRGGDLDFGPHRVGPRRTPRTYLSA